MALKNKPVIALTGATGFLGSHLMASLITKGYDIIVFGRPAKNESINERILRLLKWFGVDGMSDQVTCIDTDLSQDNLGISTGEYSRLCSVVDSVIHCYVKIVSDYLKVHDWTVMPPHYKYLKHKKANYSKMCELCKYSKISCNNY